MNCRQKTHVFWLGFWVPTRNRLAASLVPSGDAYCSTQFLGFDELSGGDEHLPGDANQFWFDFGVLGFLS